MLTTAVDRSAPKSRARTISLRYSLSYVKLFEVAFKALDDFRPFDPERPPMDDSTPHVQDVPAGFDVVVRRNELLKEPTQVVRNFPGLLRYAPRQMLHYYTDLRGEAGQAFRAMSSKTRSTVLRKVRNYSQFCGGETLWRMYRTPEEMETYFRLAVEVARKTYQERLFESGLPDTAEFRADTLELARRDAVRGFLLFHGEKPIAYLHTPAPDGFLVYEYLGYDPEYAKHSPGTVLQYLALEALQAEKTFPLYYWGYGHSQTKQIFSTGQVLGADVFYFRPTLRNRAAVALHYSVDRLSERLGKLLERLKLKQVLKLRLKGQ